MMTGPSHLQKLLSQEYPDSGHAPHLVNLAKTIAYNLENEHQWTSIRTHFYSPLDPTKPLPRPLISGLPRSRIYVHPDEQIENLIKEKRGEPLEEINELEWVLPTHLRERWSLRQFAECFDAVDENPPVMGGIDGPSDHEITSRKRRGGKRMLLATLSDDSTVVYYIIHDGIVKPRQN